MTPELRLIRYFVAVADAGTITRAAEALHLSQPSLSTAMKTLESQLGVPLLERTGRNVTLTPAGELLALRGRELLAAADELADAVRDRGSGGATRLRVGVTPTARFGVTPRLLAACTAAMPAVMLYTSEDTTGALLRDVARGRLDLAVTFCAEDAPEGVTLTPLHDEPAVVHLPAAHPLAARREVGLEDLAEETILVASGADSRGFSGRVLRAFAAVGLQPRTLADPYPDLGLQAVREGLGVVVYPRSAFPPELDGSAFVALTPVLTMPFQLAWRPDGAAPAVRAVVEVAAQD